MWVQEIEYIISGVGSALYFIYCLLDVPVSIGFICLSAQNSRRTSDNTANPFTDRAKDTTGDLFGETSKALERWSFRYELIQFKSCAQTVSFPMNGLRHIPSYFDVEFFFTSTPFPTAGIVRQSMKLLAASVF